MCLLVGFGKVLRSSANELQQNSNTSSREDYILALVSGVSGEKGKDGGEKGRELSIRRFWGKGEGWRGKRERGEGDKRLTQMFLLDPSTPTQHDSIPSNQNHFRSLGCQLHMSKSSPKINLTLRSGLWSGRVAMISLFSETSNEEFSNTCTVKPAIYEEL